MAVVENIGDCGPEGKLSRTSDPRLAAADDAVSRRQSLAHLAR
jgi:hypothetical protein